VLVGVPIPEMVESPASWLCRTAWLQGSSVAELKRYFGLPRSRDMDLCIEEEHVQALQRLCDAPLGYLALSTKILSRTLRTGFADRLLMSDEAGRAVYRYCSGCLKEQYTSHLPVHWRFSCWLWCPIHDCLLENSCPKCQRRLVMPPPSNPEKSSAEIASLRYCMTCAMDLSTNVPRPVCEPLDEVPTSQTLLNNGRAVLAALYHGHFSWRGVDRRPIGALGAVLRQGIVPCPRTGPFRHM
jgi:hypothetical protein